MKKLIMKYRKSFIASSVLVLMLITVPLYITVKNNFDKIVDISLKYFLADISHTTSDLSTFGLIVVDDAVLKDDKGITVLYAPKLTLRYSIKDLLRGKITEISADNPYLYIAVDKNRDINIVDIFATGSPGKAGVGVPIDIITVTNGRLLFQDNYYDKPINMFVNNVDGYVSFDDTHGIDLRFYNTAGDEMVDYSFTNYEKEYSMTIKLKNGDIDQDLMQYAYVDEYTNYLGGKADLDLTIDSDGLWGDAYLSKASFKTSAYDGVATDIHGGVDFLGERIKLKLDGKMGEKDVEFSLEYLPDNVEMNITASDLNKEDIKKVTLFDDTLKKKLDDLGDFNVSYLRLKFDFDKDFNLTLDNYLRLNTLNIKGAEVKDLKGSIVLSGDQVKLKDLRFFMDYDGSEGYTLLNGSYDKDILDLNFNILNRRSPLKLKELNGNFKYDLNTEKIDYTLYSDILKIGGKIDLDRQIFGISSIGTKDVEIEYKGEYYSTKNNVKVIYDYANKDLLLGEGEVEIKEKDSLRSLALNFTNNGNKIYFNKMNLFYNELQLSANGYLDIDDLSYNFDYTGKNLKVENFISVDGLETGIDFDGTFIGKKENFSLISNVESKNGKYAVSYKDIRGRLRVVNNGKLGADFDGYLGEVSYDDVEFKDFKVGLNYSDDVFKVSELRNNLLTIIGDYNIINQTLDFDYKIRGIKENKIKLLEKYGFKMDLENVDGSLKGEIKDFKIKLYSTNAWVQYEDLPKVYLKGGLRFYDQKIYFDEFKVGENNVGGYYDISSKNFRVKVNLLENNLAEYYGDVNLKYRLTGEVVLWGTPDNISGVFKTFADNVYLRGRKLPNIKMVSTYKGGNLGKLDKSGHMDINSVTISSEKGEKLLNGGGWIDLSENKISFKIKDVLDLENLKEYSETQDISGELNTYINVNGPFNDLKYDLNINSKAILIEGNKLENFKVDLHGDLKELKLKELSLSYHNNKLTSQGEINFKDFDYSLNIKSNKIDLSFLNIFSFSEYINKIKGIATIDVEINSKNNYGEFKIKDLSAEMPKYGISIDKVNTQVLLDKKLVKIDYFKGKINNGDIKMEGYLKIPAFEGIENQDSQVSKLDYKLNLVLDKVDYSYQDKINLVLSSDAVFTKNKVTGDFIINSGEILGIPDVKDTEVSNIASQIKEKEVIRKSKELGSDFEIKTVEDDGPSIDIDINLKTESPIKLKISKLTYTSIVENIYGDLNIDGNLKLKNKEISYNGMVSIDDGSIVLNNNLFYLSTATAKFIKTEAESVSFHPIVVLNANSTIANEDVYINISGEYPNLQIQMSTGSGLNEDEIGSLLTFHNVSDEKNTNVVVKDVLDREISDKLFSPISSEIASVLKIEKFQISSDLVAYEYEGGTYKDTGTLGLGASIDAENPIYKDKLYWKAKARWGASKYYDNVTEYDFALDHRITKNLSWGGGVGKIPEGRARTGDTLINYHIDLSWRKKYKNLEQIILNIFLLGGEE
ncbi:translocation/assembly module TamB domain-containing protein [Psychrilyobacter atlanticus]|uniref:translocation/assembly module TamB domain-containing protein n=1 Tax=Psychrilyobacter atlanticus TaxID=271091 RepID=UPI00042435E9|nr:translocation/assembly module TamB domain-containing protein [Psychrilyobacter atlanticus]